MSTEEAGFPEPDGDITAKLGAALAAVKPEHPGDQPPPMSPLDQARWIARELIAVCPMRALPLELMWQIRDDPSLAWVLNEESGSPRQRLGDQPPPVPNDGPSMHDLVCDDLASWPAAPGDIEAVRAGLQERKRLGLERYSSLLQAHNNRDAWRDLTEELEDAAVYAKQVIVEHAGNVPADLEMAYDAILSTLLRVRRLRDEENSEDQEAS